MTSDEKIMKAIQNVSDALYKQVNRGMTDTMLASTTTLKALQEMMGMKNYKTPHEIIKNMNKVRHSDI